MAATARQQARNERPARRYGVGLDVLHTKTVEEIHKELAMFSIAYNLVRLVMLEAAARQGVPPARISFVDALR
jgi:hypothetical protein